MILAEFRSDYPMLSQALALMGKELPFEEKQGGFPIRIQSGDGLQVVKTAGAATIIYERPVEIFRGLSLLAAQFENENYSICQHADFDSNGIMFDCSRNGVLSLDSVRFFLRKLALLGLPMMMLYTEDTYEVPGQPYFGYGRGRFSGEELKAIDDYAYTLGIEVIPCIQCLAHLSAFLRWKCTDHLRDDGSILLVDGDETYQFIEQMLRAASEPFRTKRIHIGMDEAWGLGDGNFRKKFGTVPRSEIMARHLKKVSAAVEKLGLRAMMWSDMYFRALNNNKYDIEGITMPQSVIDAAPDSIDLVYWDYYTEDQAHFDRMMAAHQRFAADTVFAGGIWTWYGPAPMVQKTVNTTRLALETCKRNGIRQVFATAWGDDGAECSPLTTLFGLAIFAQIDYGTGYDEAASKDEFSRVTGLPAETFWNLEKFSSIPGVFTSSPRSPFGTTKPLLYEDPLMPLFEKDFEGIDICAAYAPLEKEYAEYAAKYPEYEKLFRFYSLLAHTLVLKGQWREQAPKAVRTGDRPAAAKLVPLAFECKAALAELKDAWYELWMSVEKPFGFDVIDLRVSGEMGRFVTAAKRMQLFAEGKLADIEELSCEKLPYLKECNGFAQDSRWYMLASACRIAGS